MNLGRLYTLVKIFGWPYLMVKLGRQRLFWGCVEITEYCPEKCGYCTFTEVAGKHVPVEEVYKTIEWLHAKKCTIFAGMGGEPLTHPGLVDIVVRAKWRGMWVYLPTNLRHLSQALLGRLLDAGLDFLDVAVDAMEPTPGLDKNLLDIREHLAWVLEARRKRGLLVKLNVVITRKNLNDVLGLTNYATQMRIPVPYHIVQRSVEPKDPRYPWLDEEAFFRPVDADELEALCDVLQRCKEDGAPITNPSWYFDSAVELVRTGRVPEWDCRAGRSTVFVKGGNLWPCMVLRGEEHERPWGERDTTVFPFPRGKLLKQIHGADGCSTKCLSCVNTLTSEGLGPLKYYW